MGSQISVSWCAGGGCGLENKGQVRNSALPLPSGVHGDCCAEKSW